MVTSKSSSHKHVFLVCGCNSTYPKQKVDWAHPCFKNTPSCHGVHQRTPPAERRCNLPQTGSACLRQGRGRPRAGENVDGNKKHVVFVGLQSTTHIIESHTLEQVKIKKSGMNNFVAALKAEIPFSKSRMVKPQFDHMGLSENRGYSQ